MTSDTSQNHERVEKIVKCYQRNQRKRVPLRPSREI